MKLILMEDSISCSPGNDRKQSRSRQFHNKTIRRSQRMSGSSTICTRDIPFIDLLYEEPSHTTSTAQCDYFNPFESARILVTADKTKAATSTAKLSSFVQQGFVQLDKLPIRQEEYQFVEPSVDESNLKEEHILGTESQFGITESEFGRFCDEAEFESPPKPATKTANATRSIVDSILEDFCGSPYSESPPKFPTEDSTPVFLFKSKSIRTYSNVRHRKLRRNIVNELVHIKVPEDDGNVSDSSGLSVQEDLSQNIVPQLDTVDLNSSIRVCENLLNLSSYFSEATSHVKSSPTSEKGETIQCSAPAILEEILKIKRRPFVVCRSKSVDDFYGFSDWDSGSEEDTLKEFLEDEDDMLQQINCDSLCYDKVVPKVSFVNDCSEIETVLEDAKVVVEEATRYLQSRSDFRTNRQTSTIRSQQNCDNHEDQPQHSSRCSPIEDEQLFDELWDDNDLLLNYKTQKLPPIPTEEREASVEQHQINQVPNESSNVKACKAGVTFDGPSTSRQFIELPFASFLGFSTASNKPVKISKEAKRRADEIRQKFEQSEIELGMKKDFDVAKADEGSGMAVCDSAKNLYVSTNLEFSTASKKPIVISSEAKQKAKEVVKKFEMEERDRRKKDVLNTDDAYKPKTSSFVGFSTASQKPIAISNEAKQKAADIIKKFEQEEQDRRKNEALNMDGANVPATSTFVGFSTASQKPIVISNEAKQKAADIIKKFEQEERDRRKYEELNVNGAEMPTSSNRNKSETSCSTSAFVTTASQKPIEISNEAKRRGKAILAAFEKEEREKWREELNCSFSDERKPINQFEEKQSFQVPVDFSTVSKKAIAESDERLTDGNSNHRKTDQISKEVRQKAQELLMDIEFFDEVFEEELFTCVQQTITQTEQKTIIQMNSNFEGFKTASKKSIQVSEAAKRHAAQLFNQVEQEGLPQDYIECIEADLKNCGSTPSNWDINVMRNASTDGVKIKSKNKLKRMHACDTSSFGIKELNSVAQIPITNEFTKELSFQENDGTNERPAKRKRIAFNTEDLQKSPILSSPRRLSCSERARLDRTENATLHKTLSMPLIKSTSKSAFISRKNLLSLSKKKKFNSPKTVAEPENETKTPEKQPLPFTVIATPDLKEFFDSVSTSTPRVFRKGECNVTKPHPKDSLIDTDFRQINWNDSNNTLRVCNSSLNVNSNVTLTEISPSPKQRIERLKMYGEPPTLSPILMVNKCRLSGLRRGRSLMKP